MQTLNEKWRIWSDEFKDDSNTIISESKENLIERSVSGSEKDWIIRFSDKELTECIKQCFDWLKNKTNSN